MPPLSRRYEAAACYACLYGLQLRAKGWHRPQLGFYRDYIGVIGVNGKENGNYYDIGVIGVIGEGPCSP